MENENKRDNGLGIIIGLAGFLLGAFLIKKIIHSRCCQTSVIKKCDEIKLTKVNDVKILDINSRQKKILGILKERGEVSPKDLAKIEPSVSTRTLRRDMDVLVKLGVASQEGSTKSTFYKYING